MLSPKSSKTALILSKSRVSIPIATWVLLALLAPKAISYEISDAQGIIAGTSARFTDRNADEVAGLQANGARIATVSPVGAPGPAAASQAAMR